MSNVVQLSTNVACPECKEVWWRALVTVDRRTGRVNGNSLVMICASCGYEAVDITLIK